jgi:hypothetical protein
MIIYFYDDDDFQPFFFFFLKIKKKCIFLLVGFFSSRLHFSDVCRIIEIIYTVKFSSSIFTFVCFS